MYKQNINTGERVLVRVSKPSAAQLWNKHAYDLIIVPHGMTAARNGAPGSLDSDRLHTNHNISFNDLVKSNQWLDNAQRLDYYITKRVYMQSTPILVGGKKLIEIPCSEIIERWKNGEKVLCVRPDRKYIFRRDPKIITENKIYWIKYDPSSTVGLRDQAEWYLRLDAYSIRISIGIYPDYYPEIEYPRYYVWEELK